MSAPNGGLAATLDLLTRMGRATSSQLAQKHGAVASDVVLARLRKLEAEGKVARVGTVATTRRPLVIWAVRKENGAVGSSIAAADSFEFEARGGIVERLPGFIPVPPALMPVRQVHRRGTP